MYNRFINVTGLPGRNVAADLHIEHLNKVVRECIEGLGASKTERAIVRAGKAIRITEDILQSFDEQHSVRCASGRHVIASTMNDQSKIVQDLVKWRTFSSISNRKPHSSCPKTKSLLQKKSKDKLAPWMITHVPFDKLKSMDY